jgi:glycerophosphoryl diester phosphodiesterase
MIPYVESAKCSRQDGAPYGENDEVLIKNLTIGQIQSTFFCNKIIRPPTQQNDPALACECRVLRDASNLHFAEAAAGLRFCELLSGLLPGRPGSASGSYEALEERSASPVQHRDQAQSANRYRPEREYLCRPHACASALCKRSQTSSSKWAGGTRGHSGFDFRTLLVVQEQYPVIRTVYLFGDFPKFADPTLPGSDDGTNLQDQDGANTPWLAGLYWPYRSTRLTNPFRAQSSGGFEGMALSTDKTRLLPLLEKALIGGEPKTLLIHEFGLASSRMPAHDINTC